MGTCGRRFRIKLAIFQRNRHILRTDLRLLPASSSNHNCKDGNENTEIYEHNKYFELEAATSSSTFLSSLFAVIARLGCQIDRNGDALIGFRSLIPSFRRKYPYSNISSIF